MRDDEPTKWTALRILGMLCLAWAILKMSVIGYYPDEVMLQVVVPVVAGLALLGLDKLRAGSRT